jgi:hypothetical protein
MRYEFVGGNVKSRDGKTRIKRTDLKIRHYNAELSGAGKSAMEKPESKERI